MCQPGYSLYIINPILHVLLVNDQKLIVQDLSILITSESDCIRRPDCGHNVGTAENNKIGI